MAHPKKAVRAAPEATKARQPKKPYVKPALRRLGTVRELTQSTLTNGE